MPKHNQKITLGDIVYIAVITFFMWLLLALSGCASQKEPVSDNPPGQEALDHIKATKDSIEDIPQQ